MTTEDENEDAPIVNEMETIAHLVSGALDEMEEQEESEIIVAEEPNVYEGFFKEFYKIWQPVFVKLKISRPNKQETGRAEQARRRHEKRASGRYSHVGRTEAIEIGVMLILALTVGVMLALAVLGWQGDGFSPDALTPYYQGQYIEAVSARYAYSGNEEAVYSALSGWENAEDVCTAAFEADAAGNIPEGMRYLALMHIMQGDMGVATCVQSQGGLK